MANRKISIILSEWKNPTFLKRCLWSIAMRKPAGVVPYVIIPDGREETTAILKKFGSMLEWSVVENSDQILEKINTEEVFVMDSSVIAWEGAFDNLLKMRPTEKHFIVLSNTFELWPPILERLDEYGANLHSGMVKYCEQFVLQNNYYFSDKFDFMSFCSISGLEWLIQNKGFSLNIVRETEAVSLYQKCN